MNPYRNETSGTSARPRAAKNDSSWVMILAAIPILLHATHFPAHAMNVLVWIALGTGMAISGIYTVIALLFAAPRMTREARETRQHQSPGMLDPQNYDESGRAALRSFRRGCMIFGAFFALSAIAVFVFPI